MARLEFFYDCSSPWTYLAFSQIEFLAERARAELLLRPILVGGVFNAVNESVYQARANPVPVKVRYMKKDLMDWARAYGLTIKWPPSVFPVRSVDAMRMVIAAEEKGKQVTLSRALFEAYWREDRDISKPEELAKIAEAVGLDPHWLAGRACAADVKAKLKANTDELIARGGFGSPTIFVNEADMYFGNDRLALVEAAALRPAREI